MENIQNEFQNAIKTEQFDDKTIQDLYKRTNKMFKEDSILRSYFPVYLKQKTNPLMDALENLKTLVTPTKDSIVDKMILGTFCIFNVVAGQSSGMTTSSTEGGALEGFLGAATTISFNGLEQRTSERKEHESRDTKKAETSAREEAEKYERRAALRDENSSSVARHAIYCDDRYQLQIIKEKRTHLESAEKVRSTQTPEKVGMNHGSSIPQDNLVEKGIDNNHHLPPPLPPKTKNGNIDDKNPPYTAPLVPPRTGKPNITEISKKRIMGYNRPAPQIPKQKEENKPPILPPKPNFNKTHSITNLVLDDTRTKLECCNPKKQQPALLNEMYELKISDTDKNKHIIVNLSTGSIKKPDGIYFFVNPVDKPKNIILGQLGVVQGHTSLTQGENGNLQPQRVYYAGETVFKEGSLEKWTNGSGHYKPAAKNYNTSMKDIPKELLPHNKFEEGHARYENGDIR